jgi:hypothetical protein
MDGSTRATIAIVRAREAIEARNRMEPAESEPGYHDFFKHSHDIIVFDRAGTLVGIKSL